MLRIISISIFLFFVSCKEKNGEMHVLKSGVSKTGQSQLKNLPKVAFHEIEIGSSLFGLQQISPHYFGRFYNERASYYLIDSVTININRVPYNGGMTFYFLDEILYKKKYTLAEIRINDFFQHYTGNVSQDTITNGLENQRFFSVRLRKDDLNILLKKKDTNHYTIEEFHPSYPTKLRKVSMGIM